MAMKVRSWLLTQIWLFGNDETLGSEQTLLCNFQKPHIYVCVCMYVSNYRGWIPPPFGMQYSGFLDGVQYAKNWKAVRKIPGISYAFIREHNKRGKISKTNSQFFAYLRLFRTYQHLNHLTVNMHYWDRKIEKYQANTLKLTFTRIIVPVQATYCILYSLCNNYVAIMP